ncbi:MAG: hypothetical protein HOW73_40425 [Polyangiaceae bacterium]|nr:hypothetical protein [Polyangiaceae bacterium]
MRGDGASCGRGVACVCGDCGSEYGYTEKNGAGTLVINSYEPGISMSGTFQTDDGRLNGAFDVVETQ